MLLKSYLSVHFISQPYKFALSSGGFLNFGCSLFLFSIINNIIFVLKIISVRRMSMYMFPFRRVKFRMHSSSNFIREIQTYF